MKKLQWLSSQLSLDWKQWLEEGMCDAGMHVPPVVEL
jgi:hypothetical protein